MNISKYFCLFMILLYISCFLTGCNPKELPFIRERLIQQEKERTIVTEEAIKNNPELKEIDNLCQQVPRPDSFEPVNKDMGYKGRKYIAYGYYSNLDYQNAKRFYIDYFLKEGWELTDDGGLATHWLKFRKGNYYFAIFQGGMGEDMNYSIHCEKL